MNKYPQFTHFETQRRKKGEERKTVLLSRFKLSTIYNNNSFMEVLLQNTKARVASFKHITSFRE